MTPRSNPQLITTKAAAELLSVSPRTVLNWIRDDAIPFVELPSRGRERHEYRIPLHGLLRSLSGNYDLAAELRAADEADTQSAEASPAVAEAPR
jgi:excisionase family DNA binding protein